MYASRSIFRCGKQNNNKHPDHIVDEVEEIVKSKGITSEKALEQLINQSLKTKKGSKNEAT